MKRMPTGTWGVSMLVKGSGYDLVRWAVAPAGVELNLRVREERLFE